MKKTFAILLALVMLFTCGAFILPAAAESGTCGENLTWTLDDGGNLTISGTGAMENYDLEGGPWGKGLWTVTIGSGVTSIGACAFYECGALSSVTIGSGVKTIGFGAFSGCGGLGTIRIPASVETIADYAFYGCGGLASAELNAGLKTVGGYVFQNCPILNNVSFPDTVTEIGEYTFSGCQALSQIRLPAGLKVIRSRLFAECSGLSEIDLPAGLEEIEYEAFIQSALSWIELPGSMRKIGRAAFADCEHLGLITLPDIPLEIGAEAFQGTAWFENVSNWNDGVLLYCGRHLIRVHAETSVISVNVRPDTLSVAAEAFSGCEALAEVALPNELSVIGAAAFSGCTMLSNLALPLSLTVIPESLCENCTFLSYVAIPNGVTKIEPFAFMGCTELPGITLPESLVSMDRFVFSGCASLISVEMPRFLKTIGHGAFEGCASLETVIYGGTAEDRAKIEIGPDNEPLLNVTWQYGNPDALPFSDVSEEDWFYDAVDFCVTHGLFSGTSETTFEPRTPMTRAMFVMVLANLSGVDTSDNDVPTEFTDVPRNQWFTLAVKWAHENGIVSGVGGGLFKPNDPVTREQICVMFVNYCNFAHVTLTPVREKIEFEDAAEISGWAREAVETCQTAGLVEGAYGRFNPKNNATRAEVAQIFTNFLTRA